MSLTGSIGMPAILFAAGVAVMTEALLWYVAGARLGRRVLALLRELFAVARLMRAPDRDRLHASRHEGLAFREIRFGFCPSHSRSQASRA